MNDKTLINWGSYDVDNFGDLLFPFIIEHYLGNRYSKIIHVSPTGKRSIWPDTIPTCTISEALKDNNIGGLIVGGGNLISWTTSSSINYIEDYEFSRIVHPSFFYVPYILRVKYNIPFAYNYIGVAKPIPIEKQNIVKIAIESASFISCRDQAGADHLIRSGVTLPISVGLDSAIDISHVFSKEYLINYYYNNVQKKYNIPKNKVLATIHVKKRYLKNQFNELFLILSFLIKNSIHPVLVPLGMCHEDDLVLCDQNFQGNTATVIRKPDMLIDILSIISLSEYYIGSSLHGAITSLSYHNKIVIVADEVGSRLSKFSGFLTQINLSECLYSSWSDVYMNLETHGVSILKTISSSKVIELNNKNTWNDIYNSLHDVNKNNINILQNDTLEKYISFRLCI